MDDRRALMAAIIAEPDEDTPRLALADWLQEHGDKHDQARAEFIRLQVQAATLPAGKPRDKLEAAAEKLERKHRKAWVAPMVALGSDFTPDDYVGFERGLLSYQWVHTDKFLLKDWQTPRAEALAAVGVQGLLFHSATKRVSALAASPGVRWVAEILYPGADDDALAIFGRAPNLAHLSALDLQEVGVTDKGLRTFAEKSNMTRLRELHITPEGALTKRKAKFSSAGVLALLTSGRFPLLTSLDVEGVPPAKFGAAAFFADPALKQLTKLALDIRIPMALVVACPHLTNLRELRMHDTAMTDAECQAILASRVFANLKELSLYLPVRLSAASEAKLREWLGDGLALEYHGDVD